MRTTISSDEQMFATIKQGAKEKGLSISCFIENCLRIALEQMESRVAPSPFELITVKEELVDPYIDLDRTSELIYKIG